VVAKVSQNTVAKIRDMIAEAYGSPSLDKAAEILGRAWPQIQTMTQSVEDKIELKKIHKLTMAMKIIEFERIATGREP
jgi:hypothetical protein